MSLSNGHPHSAHVYHEELRQEQQKLSIRSIPEFKRASFRAELATVSLLDVLAQDERPTFVVDASSLLPPDGTIEPVYCNAALVAAEELLLCIEGNDYPMACSTNGQTYTAFKNWLLGAGEEHDAAKRGNSYAFEGYLWSTIPIAESYRLVSGVYLYDARPRAKDDPKNMPQLLPERLPTIPADAPVNPKDSGFRPAPGQHGPYDYTLETPPAAMSEHIRYFRNVNWSKTPLGPMSVWSPQLRCVVNMLMNDSHPSVLFWGDEVTLIYNESYIQLIGLMHPCMGQSARVAAKEYWPILQPLINHINLTGQTLSEQDMPFFLDRHGFLEESFFSFQIIPILGSTGHIAGYYQPLMETTTNNLLERRVYNLVELGSRTAKARNLEAYWNLVLDTLATNDKDAPFALLYAAEESLGSVGACTHSPGSADDLEECVLKGAIGVDAGHPLAPPIINMKSSSDIFNTFLLQAAKSRKATLVHFEELGLDDSIFAGIQWKGYGDACRSVIMCPLLPTNSEQVLGFLILGVNPRRPFDDDYQQYVHVMLRLLATSLASVVLYDEEKRQNETAIGQAARVQEELLTELQLREKKFQRFAERADVAIFTMDPTGNYTYRNRRWFDIFEAAADNSDARSVWNRIVFPEDIPICEGFFAKLVVGKVPICFELKTSMMFHPPATDAEPECQKQEHYKWILCSAYPEIGPDNEVIEVVGNVTDISRQKWAEGTQKMRTDSALESKKHLEHFIDTTSHEMRNPLSAIMQCADGIISSYCQPDSESELPSPVTYSSLLEQTLDAAQTIAHCAQHMKRIVDDILTVSKLDSGLLVITPVDVQPESVSSHAVKMFESEAKAAGVDLTLEISPSYRELAVDWVSLDPTRMLQVLINLITNAVKFTRLETTRKITVSIGASISPPMSQPGSVEFVDPKLVDDDLILVEDWKKGPTVYLQFSVIDTGRGLSEEEKSTLFARFSQASPRTHINYGGSGLGLFISRRLTEMQGGAIGLASEFRKGSTFSFYIKARRTESNEERRDSIPRDFPEDIKHRAQTSKEIDRLLNPQRPPVQRHKSHEVSHGAQYLSSDAGGIREPVGNASKLSTSDSCPQMRRQSTIHPDVPREVLGLPSEPPLEDFRRRKSIPETLHVLVVEDNLVNQKVLARQLRNLGCVVSVANHGVEALDFLSKTKCWNNEQSLSASRNHSFVTKVEGTANRNSPELPVDLSLILMDWEMPIMDGLTCVAKIRELERDGFLLERILVIGVTANVRQQQIQTAMDVGMDDVVGKPFRVVELLRRMRGVVVGEVGLRPPAE